MKNIIIDNNKSPNFIGSWDIENVNLCEDIIKFFEQNKNLQQKHSGAIDVKELLEKLKPQEKVDRIIADKASLMPTPTPHNSPEGAWA